MPTIQTTSLIRATFPPGLAGLVASYTLAPKGADILTIGLFGCLEELAANRTNPDCYRGAACAGRLNAITHILNGRMPARDCIQALADGAAYGGWCCILTWLYRHREGSAVDNARSIAASAGHIWPRYGSCYVQSPDIYGAINGGALNLLRDLYPNRHEHISWSPNDYFSLACRQNIPVDIRLDAYRAEPRDYHGVMRFLIAHGATTCTHCGRSTSDHLPPPFA